jgi:hypothetical protein
MQSVILYCIFCGIIDSDRKKVYLILSLRKKVYLILSLSSSKSWKTCLSYFYKNKVYLSVSLRLTEHLLSNNKTLTRTNLVKRRHVEDKSFLFCSEQETVSHLFFDCCVATGFGLIYLIPKIPWAHMGRCSRLDGVSPRLSEQSSSFVFFFMLH